MPFDQIEEPAGIIVPVEESVLKQLLADVRAIRDGIPKMFDHQNERLGARFDKLDARVAKLEKEHRDSGYEYRVLRDAIDHARRISLRVETRLNNMEELESQRKMRARAETLPGVGDGEAATDPGIVPSVEQNGAQP